MEPRDPSEQALWLVRLFPKARRVLVGFRQGGVDVDRAENLVQADTVAHGQHIFGDQVARVLAHDSDAENPVAAGHRPTAF